MPTSIDQFFAPKKPDDDIARFFGTPEPEGVGRFFAPKDEPQGFRTVEKVAGPMLWVNKPQGGDDFLSRGMESFTPEKPTSASAIARNTVRDVGMLGVGLPMILASFGKAIGESAAMAVGPEKDKLPSERGAKKSMVPESAGPLVAQGESIIHILNMLPQSVVDWATFLGTHPQAGGLNPWKELLIDKKPIEEVYKDYPAFKGAVERIGANPLFNALLPAGTPKLKTVKALTEAAGFSEKPSVGRLAFDTGEAAKAFKESEIREADWLKERTERQAAENAKAKAERTQQKETAFADEVARKRAERAAKKSDMTAPDLRAEFNRWMRGQDSQIADIIQAPTERLRAEAKTLLGPDHADRIAGMSRDELNFTLSGGRITPEFMRGAWERFMQGEESTVPQGRSETKAFNVKDEGRLVAEPFAPKVEGEVKSEVQVKPEPSRGVLSKVRRVRYIKDKNVYVALDKDGRRIALYNTLDRVPESLRDKIVGGPKAEVAPVEVALTVTETPKGPEGKKAKSPLWMKAESSPADFQLTAQETIGKGKAVEAGQYKGNPAVREILDRLATETELVAEELTLAEYDKLPPETKKRLGRPAQGYDTGNKDRRGSAGMPKYRGKNRSFRVEDKGGEEGYEFESRRKPLDMRTRHDITALEKAYTGEPLTPKQEAAVKYLLDERMKAQEAEGLAAMEAEAARAAKVKIRSDDPMALEIKADELRDGEQVYAKGEWLTVKREGEKIKLKDGKTYNLAEDDVVQVEGVRSPEGKDLAAPEITTEQTPAGEQFTFGGQREVPTEPIRKVGRAVKDQPNQADVFSPDKTAPGNLPQDQGAIEFHAGFNPLPYMSKAFQAATWKRIKQEVNRVKSAPPKIVFEKIEKTADPVRANLRGEAEGNLASIGVEKIAKNPATDEAIGIAMRNGDYSNPMAVKLRQFFDDWRQKAVDAGFNVGKIENYLTETPQSEIAQKIRDDVTRTVHKHRELRDPDLADRQMISDILESLMKGGKDGFSAETIAQIEHMMKEYKKGDPKKADLLGHSVNKTGAIDPVEAFGKLWSWASHTTREGMPSDIARILFETKRDKTGKKGAPFFFRPHGAIEFGREISWKPDYLENRASVLALNYALGVGRRIAETTAFGKKHELLKQLREQTAKISAEDLAQLDRILDIWDGRSPVNPPPPAYVKTMQAVTAAEVATKIGGGFATVLNVPQTWWSVGPTAGFGNLALAMKDFVTNKLPDGGKARDWARGTGVVMSDPVEVLTGRDWLHGKLGEHARKVIAPFTQMNIGNSEVAALAFRRAAPKLWKRANSKGGTFAKGEFSPERAQRFLEDNGVDWRKPLTEDATRRGSYRFGADSQQQTNILRDPEIANNPWIAPWLLFKRYQYRSLNWVNKNIWKEMTEHGNPVPLLRFAIATQASGEFIEAAKTLIKKLASGEVPSMADFSRNDEEMLGRIANNVLSTATLGWFSDAFTSTVVAEKGGKVGTAIERTVTPVQISEAARIFDILDQVGTDIAKGLPVGAVAQRAVKPVSKVFGSIPSEIAKNAQTAGQKESVRRLDYGNSRTSIFEAWRDGDFKRARNIIAKYNAQHPEAPMVATFGKEPKGKRYDISQEEYNLWLKRNAKSEAKSDVTYEYDKKTKTYKKKINY